MLISAFGRGTQDPFGPSRQASIYALLHSEKFFTLKDVATKILPVVCHATIDPELDVRQQVNIEEEEKPKHLRNYVLGI